MGNRFSKIRIREEDVAYTYRRPEESGREVPKAYLIHMPENSRFANCSFWHPSKCLYMGELPGTFVMSFDSENWAFELSSDKKDEYGQYNTVAILTPQQMQEEWAVINADLYTKERQYKQLQKLQGNNTEN